MRQSWIERGPSGSVNAIARADHAVHRRGSPLRPAEGEAAFEIWLPREGSRPDEPRSVWILSGKEKRHALPVDVVIDSDSCFVQGKEGQPGRVRVRIQLREL